MGQQQLLLIVLGVIVVGIAIVVGINLFNANSIESNKSAVVADLNNLSAKAMQYFKTPAEMDGGGNNFTGFAIPTKMDTTANGIYTIETAGGASSIKFKGAGTESGVTKYATVTSAGVITISDN